MVVLGIGITSITAPEAAGQQSYRPPVHISPNQQYDANKRYSGIVALDSNAPQNQPIQQTAPHVNPSPHLQARIANAFKIGGQKKRNQRPAQTQARLVQPQRHQQVSAPPTPISEHDLEQEYIPHHMRDQVVQGAARNRKPVTRYGSQPVEQVVQRRAQPNRYPVQPIQASQKRSVLQIEGESSQQVSSVGVVPDPYYDQPNVRVTSAQEIEEEMLPALDTEPSAPEPSAWRKRGPRVSQTPVYPPMREEPVTQMRPVSILNASESSSNIDPRFNLQDEDTDSVENTLREFDEIDEVEEIDEEEEDDPIEDEELPEREREALDQSCEELRYEMLNDPITSIALDISPPRSEFISQVGAPYRTWTDQFGRTMGTGAVSNLRRGHALIQTGAGWQKVPVGNMSDGDLQAMASYWQLPKECTVSTSSFTGRNWIPQTVTWKASNLCHKPLFFENIQLERYGHSHGPFIQPVQSTVHFFSSLAMVPYNMGITPANECQYALGFYRPGNCAPWLKEPFPISLAGARYQATALTAGAFLFFP